jgi:hypothetical protein
MIALARTRPAVAGLSAALALGSSGASADEPSGARSLATPRPEPTVRGDSGFALDVTVGLTLPLVASARVALEVPGHVVIHCAAGLVPTFLVDAINDVGTGWGAWNDGTAGIVSSLLADATWLQVGLGLRPAGSPGIEVSVAYVLLWTHRGVSGRAFGGPDAMPERLGLDFAVQAIHGELAWQAHVLGPLYFRIGLGWVHALGWSVSLATGSRDPSVQEAADAVAAALAEEAGQRAFGPTVSLSLGIQL